MISFNPYWGGLDYMQDTPPQDGMAIAFFPSIASDVTAGQLQLDSESSVKSFMQAQFRIVSENTHGYGLLISADI